MTSAIPAAGKWKLVTNTDMKKKDMEFHIDDIVIYNGQWDCPLYVAGVIHDSKRLFVTDPSMRCAKGKEFEIDFDDVTEQFRRIWKTDKE